MALFSLPASNSQPDGIVTSYTTSHETSSVRVGAQEIALEFTRRIFYTVKSPFIKLDGDSNPIDLLLMSADHYLVADLGNVFEPH